MSALCVLLGVARQLLGQARLAHPGLAEQEQQRRPRVADRVLDAVAEEPELRFATDQPGPVALGPVPGRSHGGIGPPGRDELLAALGVDRLQGVVANGATGGGEGGRAHEHLAGLGGGLQAVGRVHHVAHRGVVAAGAQRAHQHLARVHADAHADVDVELGRVRRQRLLHAQRGAHGALGVVLVGGGRAEEGDDGVADDLVHPPAEGVDVGHQPLEAPVDEVLHLLRVARLGERRVADQVREEHRDDPTLVPPQPQVLPALRAEPCARRHVSTTAGAGHRARIYRGASPNPVSETRSG